MATHILTDIDKIRLVDSIIEQYPDLKKERSNFIRIVLEKILRPNKLILERFSYNNEIYYKYEDGIIIDNNLKIKGYMVDNKPIIIRPINRSSIHTKFIKDMDKKFYNK